jgi:hypothetical protein
VQIQKLKSHLTTQQRGNRSALVGSTMIITPGLTGGNASSTGRDDGPSDMEDPEYNLRQETTEFLTQLSQTLSDENDSLIGLVRSTLSTLKELQGLPENIARAGGVQMPDGHSDHMLQALPTSYDSLASDMETVLDNLRNLLTNPNFVPIEEVSVRDDEIQKLRAGWEKMESKWREAMEMLDGWRKRMADGGDRVNLDEIKRGLGLGRELKIKNAPLGQAMIASAEDDDTTGEVEYLSDIGTDDEGQSMTTSDIAPPSKASKHADDIPQPLVEATGNGRSPRKVAFKQDIQAALDENAASHDRRQRNKSPGPNQSITHPPGKHSGSRVLRKAVSTPFNRRILARI